MPSGTPLPPLASPQFQGSGLHEQPNAVAAYEKVLKAEAQAVQDGTNQDLVHARVAGYLVLELYAIRDVLGDQPFTTVINDIVRSSQDCEGKGDHSVVYGVGKKYLDNLVRPGELNRLLFALIVYVTSQSFSSAGPGHPATHMHVPTPTFSTLCIPLARRQRRVGT